MITFVAVRMLSKILLTLSVALLFMHQLIPHDHDERESLVFQYSPAHNGNELSDHDVAHIFLNNSSQSTVKCLEQSFNSINPVTVERCYVTLLTNVKPEYEHFKPPLIIYYCNPSLKAPPLFA